MGCEVGLAGRGLRWAHLGGDGPVDATIRGVPYWDSVHSQARQVTMWPLERIHEGRQPGDVGVPSDAQRVLRHMLAHNELAAGAQAFKLAKKGLHSLAAPLLELGALLQCPLHSLSQVALNVRAPQSGVDREEVLGPELADCFGVVRGVPGHRADTSSFGRKDDASATRPIGCRLPHRVSLARLGAEPQALDGAYDRWIMLAGRR